LFAGIGEEGEGVGEGDGERMRVTLLRRAFIF